MNIFLCRYTGKLSKIAIFWSKKGLPSEDVASNAIMTSTNDPLHILNGHLISLIPQDLGQTSETTDLNTI